MRAVLAALALTTSGCPGFGAPCERDSDCGPAHACSALGWCEACGADDPRCTAPAACEGFVTPQLDAWEMLGRATRVGSAVRLTGRDQPDSAGLTRSPTLRRAETFTLEAVFRTEYDQGNNPDGFGFGWFEDGPLEIGTKAVGLGIIGLKGYAVVVDTFANPNWDAGIGTHVALVRTTGVPDNASSEELAPYLERIAIRPIPLLPPRVPHVLTLDFDRGRATVWLDGEHLFDARIEGYVPFEARFAAAASTGDHTGDQDLLELRLRCGPDDHAPFTARRRLRLTGRPGTTVTVPLPERERPGSAPDGRDVAVYQGRFPIRSGWSEDGAALYVEVPERDDEPVYLYFGGDAAPRSGDHLYALAGRFHAGTSSWRGWQSCPDHAGDRRSRSACAIAQAEPEKLDGYSFQLLESPLVRAGPRYELQFYTAGGGARPEDILFAAVTATGTHAERAAPLPSDAWSGPLVPTTTTAFRTYPRGMPGFHREVGAPWQLVRARFEAIPGTNALLFGLVTPSEPTDARAAQVELDDVLLRIVDVPEGQGTLEPIEALPAR